MVQLPRRINRKSRKSVTRINCGPHRPQQPARAHEQLADAGDDTIDPKGEAHAFWSDPRSATAALEAAIPLQRHVARSYRRRLRRNEEAGMAKSRMVQSYDNRAKSPKW